MRVAGAKMRHAVVVALFSKQYRTGTIYRIIRGYDMTNKPLSERLSDTAIDVTFDGAALRIAFESEHVTEAEKAVLTRWMYGSQTLNDRWSLQDLSIKFYRLEATA